MCRKCACTQSSPPLTFRPLAAEALVAALVAQWQKPIDTLGKAGRAFDVSGGGGQLAEKQYKRRSLHLRCSCMCCCMR